MREVVPPSGLSRDGASTFYARYAIPAREHSLRVKLNDDARSQSIGYAREALIHPVPGQVVVVEFSGRKEGFVIQ